MEAKRIFEQMNHPDHVTYTAMSKFVSDFNGYLFVRIVNSYGLNGMAADATELYHQMPRELINEKTHVCVLNACSHSGFVNEARSIFQNIQVKNKWTYTTMVIRNIFDY